MAIAHGSRGAPGRTRGPRVLLVGSLKSLGGGGTAGAYSESLDVPGGQTGTTRELRALPKPVGQIICNIGGLL